MVFTTLSNFYVESNSVKTHTGGRVHLNLNKLRVCTWTETVPGEKNRWCLEAVHRLGTAAGKLLRWVSIKLKTSPLFSFLFFRTPVPAWSIFDPAALLSFFTLKTFRVR